MRPANERTNERARLNFLVCRASPIRLTPTRRPPSLAHPPRLHKRPLTQNPARNELAREGGRIGRPALPPSKFVNFPPLLFFAIFLWQQQQRRPLRPPPPFLPPSPLQGLPFLPCRPQLSQPLLPLLGNKEMEDGRSVGGTGGRASNWYATLT